jgi:superfamily I DNA/RNA helicase
MGDVVDGEIVREKRVDHHGRRTGHQRADQIERPDAALDQAPGPPPRAGHRGDRSVAADNERSEEKETAAGVTLITLHAVKGLEFPHVFLIGAEDGLLPHERSKRDGVLDEERRLFYVGMTRAMRSLVITWCRARRKFGSPTHCRRSPFLEEIGRGSVVEESYEELANRPMETEEVAVQFARLRAQLSGR